MSKGDQTVWNDVVSQHLAVFPVFGRRDVCKSSPVTRYHRQPGVELHFTSRGRGAFCLDDEIYVHEGRYLVLLSGDCPHQVFADPNSHYERTVVCFDRSILDELVNWRGCETLKEFLPSERQGYFPRLPVDVWSDVEACMARIVHEFNAREHGWEAVVMATLIQTLVTIERFGEGVPMRRSDELLNRCVAIVNANLDQDLTVSSIAAMIPISPKHLSRTFSASTGMTLSDYIARQRCVLAKRLLEKRSDLLVGEIATRCGFKTLAHFSATFSKHVGKSPSQYRALIHAHADFTKSLGRS